MGGKDTTEMYFILDPTKWHQRIANSYLMKLKLADKKQ